MKFIRDEAGEGARRPLQAIVPSPRHAAVLDQSLHCQSEFAVGDATGEGTLMDAEDMDLAPMMVMRDKDTKFTAQ